MWDPKTIGITGEAVSRALLDGEPRIVMDPARGANAQLTGVSVTPYMMAAGDEKIIADKLVAILSKPPAQPAVAAPKAAAGDLTGQWTVRVQYAASTSTHSFLVTQKGNDLGGYHQGDFMTRELTGTVDGDAVRIRSAFGEQHGDSINLTFSGKLAGDQMSGTLDMGEYLGASWTATRRGGRRA
jgi:L-seryl-tRNA(Ser) seleniumtransferase